MFFVFFFNTSNDESIKEIKKAIPSITISTGIKYLGINSFKEAKICTLKIREHRSKNYEDASKWKQIPHS